MNLDEVFHFVAPAVRIAGQRAASQLARLGIRHALAVGLAFSAHGYIRATSDIERHEPALLALFDELTEEAEGAD
jgi:hypothetical protein